MNMQSLRQMPDPPRFFPTIETFFDWAEGQTEKYELVDGVPRLLPNVKRAHSLIVSNLVVALAMRLDGDRFFIHTGEFGTRTGERSLRFADVMVEAATRQIADRTTNAPILLVEVLSNSTADVDFGVKLVEYQTLDSLQTYVILDQVERCAWVWQRDDGGRWPADPAVTKEGQLALPFLTSPLPFDAIYRNVL